MQRGSTVVLTGLTDEPFFVECRHKLRAKDGTQRLKIVSIDELRMERENDLKKWTTVLDTEDFDLDILDDGSFEDALIRGLLKDVAVVGVGGTLDEYSAANQDGTDSLFSGVPPKAGQLVYFSRRVIVSALSFHLAKTGTPNGLLTAELWGSNGTVPTGSALGSGTLDVSTLGASLAMTSIPLSAEVEIEAGWYGVSANYNGGDVSNRVSIGRDNTSPTHVGHGIAQSVAGIWSANTSIDRPFVITGSIPVAPSDRYMLIAECTVEDLVTGAQTPDVFRAPARVVPSALNPIVAGIS